MQNLWPYIIASYLGTAFMLLWMLAVSVAQYYAVRRRLILRTLSLKE